MIVIRVKISPAFAPNALEPPMPPRAPAKPPPRPRCTSTSKIRKIARNDKTRASSALMDSQFDRLKINHRDTEDTQLTTGEQQRTQICTSALSSQRSLCLCG